MFCSGHGTCNPIDGSCTCDQCHYGGACENAISCGVHGTCISSLGCECYPGYGPGGYNKTCVACPACTGGANCATVNTCGGHGTCQPQDGTCVCAAGYDPGSGCTTCDICHAGISSGCSFVIQTCSGHGTCNAAEGGCVCDNGWAGGDCSELSAAAENARIGGGVAAGIIIPTAIVAIAAALYVWRVRNPYRPWSSLVPTWISSRMPGTGGSASYQRVGWSTSSGGSASASAPLSATGSGSGAAGSGGATSSGSRYGSSYGTS